MSALGQLGLEGNRVVLGGLLRPCGCERDTVTARDERWWRGGVLEGGLLFEGEGSRELDATVWPSLCRP